MPSVAEDLGGGGGEVVEGEDEVRALRKNVWLSSRTSGTI